eukprot:3279255-Prymnesium_polylepis.1
MRRRGGGQGRPRTAPAAAGAVGGEREVRDDAEHGVGRRGLLSLARVDLGRAYGLARVASHA